MGILYVALGGGFGAVMRYILGSCIQNGFASEFPFGTLFVNTTGSFLIGFLFYFFGRHNLPEELKLFLMTGFLGAYTTFSTYSLETVKYLLSGDIRTAVINFVVNNAVCFFCVAGGIVLAERIFHSPTF